MTQARNGIQIYFLLRLEVGGGSGACRILLGKRLDCLGSPVPLGFCRTLQLE